MCRNIIILCLVMFASGVSAWDGKVVGITDGDTISVMKDGKSVRIRLAEIDSPEKAQAFGGQSRKSLSDLCFNTNATVNEKTIDHYGRIVGRVFCNGVDVNAEQVRLGMAWAYTQYLSDNSIAVLEKDARQSKIGLWADKDPIAPWDFRHGGIKNIALVSPDIKPDVNPKSKTGSFECSGKTRCGQMNSCDEARFYLDQCGVSSLDRDKDGIPCESLCR